MKLATRRIWGVLRFAMVMMMVLALAGCAGSGSQPSAATQPAPKAGSDSAKAPAAPATAPTTTAAAQYKPTPLATPVKVRIGYLPAIAAVPLYIGLEKGYFKAEGLEVEAVALQSGAQLLPAMASGQLEAGLSSPGAALFNAIGREIPLKIVADDGQYRKGYRFGALVVRKDLVDSGAVKDVKDLKGKTVAVTGKGVATHMMAVRMFEDIGLKESDMKIQTMGFPDMLAALASKQIDAAQMAEPFVTQGVEQGTLVSLKGHDELFPDQQQTVLMYSPKFIEANKEAANRFAVAWLRAIRDYMAAYGPQKTNQAEISAMIATQLKAKDAKLFERAGAVGFDMNGLVNAADLKVQQDWYVKQGLVKEPVKIEDVVDHRFVEHAQQLLGKK